MSNFPIPVELLENALVTPLILRRGVPGYSGAVEFLGGIYDVNGLPNAKSLLNRSYGAIQAHENGFAPQPAAATLTIKEAIYGGILFGSYGHFLLETLSRTWFLINSSKSDILFHVTPYLLKDKHSITFEDLPIWQQELLTALVGDIQRLKFINQLTKVEILHIPAPGIVIQSYFEKQHAVAMSTLGQRIPKDPQKVGLFKGKIWLSRSLLSNGRIAGEAEFENALLNEGIKVIHPQFLSLSEQIQLFEEAEIILGFEGSAFHTLVLARNQEAKLIHFSRGAEFNKNYYLCTEASGFRAEFYNFFIRYGMDVRVGSARNVLQDISGIWQKLRQQKLVQLEKYHDPQLAEKLQRLDQKIQSPSQKQIQKGVGNSQIQENRNMKIAKLAIDSRSIFKIGESELAETSVIEINGANNTVEIGDNVKGRVLIKVVGSNSKVVIKDNVNVLGGILDIVILRGDSLVSIGDGCTFQGHVRLFNHEPCAITIGGDCMFSGDIMVSTSDIHGSIFNAENIRINKPIPIEISDHVWVNTGARILKGAVVGQDVVISISSLVLEGIYPASSMLEGIPAKVIQKGIYWTRKIP